MNPPNPTTSPQNRWLLVIGLFAALTHGGYAFFAPDRGDFAKLASTPVAQPPSAVTSSSARPQQNTAVPASTDPCNSRSPDEREYLDLAVSLADNGELRLPTGDVAKRLPLYPALLSLIYRTQPPETWHSAAILVQSLLAWCNTLLIALIAAKLADSRAGLVAGLIAALYAPLLYLQTLFLTETLIIFLLLAATLAYLSMLISNDGHSRENESNAENSNHCRAPHGGVPPANRQVAAGVAPANSRCHAAASRAWLSLTMTSTLIGLASLARPNAILFLIPFIVHHVYRQMRQHRPLVKHAITMTLPAALLLGAWEYRNHQLLGRPTLSTLGGLNLYLGHNPDYALNPGLDNADYDRFDRIRREQHLTELQADDQLNQEAWRFIRENPGQTLRNTLTKIKVWFTPTILSFGPVLPLLLTAVCTFFAWRGRMNPGKPRMVKMPATRKNGGVEQANSLFHTSDARSGLPPPWRWLITIAFTAALLAYIGHLTSNTYRKLPFTSPSHVLLIGFPALILLRTRPPVRGLFIALVLTQLLVAILYIPLSRIRWTIDPFFIIAIAVATSHFCTFLLTVRSPHPKSA